MIRLHVWKLSSYSSKRHAFQQRLLRKQQQIEIILSLDTRRNGRLSVIGAMGEAINLGKATV